MTASADLPALLQRAAQALPDLFMRDTKGDRWLFLGDGRHMGEAYRVGTRHRWDYVTVCAAGMDREARWLLREAVEQEIKARGWGFNLYDHGKGITPVAEIITPPYGEPVASTGDTPAQALLAALLSAVEAQA